MEEAGIPEAFPVLADTVVVAAAVAESYYSANLKRDLDKFPRDRQLEEAFLFLPAYLHPLAAAAG